MFLRIREYEETYLRRKRVKVREKKYSLHNNLMWYKDGRGVPHEIIMITGESVLAYQNSQYCWRLTKIEQGVYIADRQISKKEYETNW